MSCYARLHPCSTVCKRVIVDLGIMLTYLPAHWSLRSGHQQMRGIHLLARQQALAYATGIRIQGDGWGAGQMPAKAVCDVYNECCFANAWSGFTPHDSVLTLPSRLCACQGNVLQMFWLHLIMS